MSVIGDRIFETTTTQGTGTVNLAGAQTGYEAFSDRFSNSDELYYVITQADANGDISDWEIGIGTLTTGSPDTLSRDTVLQSSNSDSAVNFGSGTKNVFNAPPSILFQKLREGRILWADAGGTADAITATYSPVVNSLSDGQLFYVRAGAANATTTPTFQPDSQTARTIVKKGGSALIAGDIAGDGHELILRYDSGNTRYELLNPASGLSALVDDTSPQLGGQLDVNGNPLGDGTLELLKFSETGSAVNEFTIANAATGNGPELQATGDDTNIDIEIVPKGTGSVNLLDAPLKRPELVDYGETVNAIGSIGGGTQDIDLESGNVVTATVDTSETTFTFSNSPASGTAGSFTLILTDGGSQTVNWPASVDWAGGTAPSLTSSGVDVLAFFTTDGGTTWYGFSAGLDMS